MKTKLLRKAKKSVKLFEKDGKYITQWRGIKNEFTHLGSAMYYYRGVVIHEARRIFGQKRVERKRRMRLR